MPCNDTVSSQFNGSGPTFSGIRTLHCYLDLWLNTHLIPCAKHLIPGGRFYDGVTLAADFQEIADQAAAYVANWTTTGTDVDVTAEVETCQLAYLTYLKATQVPNRYGGTFGSIFDLASGGVDISTLHQVEAAKQG